MVFVIIALAAASVYLVVGTYMNSKVHYLATHCWSVIARVSERPIRSLACLAFTAYATCAEKWHGIRLGVVA